MPAPKGVAAQRSAQGLDFFGEPGVEARSGGRPFVRAHVNPRSGPSLSVFQEPLHGVEAKAAQSQAYTWISRHALREGIR